MQSTADTQLAEQAYNAARQHRCDTPKHTLAHHFMHTHPCMQAQGVSASWSQTTDEVQLRVPVDSSVRGKDICFEVHPLRLKLAVDGSTLLEGRLEDAGSIRADGGWHGRRRSVAAECSW